MPAGLWKQSLCQSFLYCCRYSSLCCRMISEFGLCFHDIVFAIFASAILYLYLLFFVDILLLLLLCSCLLFLRACCCEGLGYTFFGAGSLWARYIAHVARQYFLYIGTKFGEFLSMLYLCIIKALVSTKNFGGH